MLAAKVMRARFDTFDYDADTNVSEAETDVILPLMRRNSAVVPAMPKRPLPASPSPMIVDKDQLVKIIRVVRAVPPTVPPRVRRLSALVREERTTRERHARERIWLVRILTLLVVMLVTFVATRPFVGASLHRGCAAYGWCAGGPR